MRVGIAGISHESNSFSSQPTTLEWFKEGGTFRGEEIIAQYRGSHNKVAGYLAGAEQFDYTAVPLYVANAMPMGPLTSDTFEVLVSEMLEAIRSAGHLDGLFLYIHGAMVSQEYPDGDGEICARGA